MTSHPSNSKEQQIAEKFILDSLAKKFNYNFSYKENLPININVKPDAIDYKNKIVVEVYAHIGKAKGGQLHKIKGDILKLALIGKKLGSYWKKIICFASDETAMYVKGNSWVAEAVKEFDIEVYTLPLTEELKNKIISAQKRQYMVNQS